MNPKYIFSFLLFFLIHLSPNAQTALAKLKFEDAETAYNNGDYNKAALKLDEAEKLFGKTNPPILHLRILILDKQLQKDVEWSSLNKLLTNCLSFLKDYEDVEALEEKYRDVYKIYASVTEKYGSNEEEYNLYLKKRKEKQIAIEELEKNKPAKVYVFRQTAGAFGIGVPLGLYIRNNLVCELNNNSHMLQLLPKGEHKLRIKGVSADKRHQKNLEKTASDFTLIVESNKTYFIAMRLNIWTSKLTLELLTEEAGRKSLQQTSQVNCDLQAN